ncbi:ribosomal protein L7/L12 [Aquabacterium humicola]|uniref:ribosomal protein L7/L12 n=1 Tax=Aquabacterium humicola TaxID=3237377 RepID=UPI002542D90E|nr:ribosomal protein L7/L12 [Rubrivivax pictus]
MSQAPLPDDVRAALQRGSLIEAIKLLRRAGVTNLAQAKAMLEAEARRMGSGAGTAARTPGRPTVATSPGGLPAAALAALRQGRKIEAIRIVREHHGLGLKEAKDFVESHERSMPITADSLSPGDGLSPGEVPRTGNRITWLLVAAVIGAGLLYHFLLRSPG